LKQLCIASGKAVWVLYIDIYCLDFDGNAFDVALAALSSALLTGEYLSSKKKKTSSVADDICYSFSLVKLPEVQFDEDEGSVSVMEDGSHASLPLLSLPLSLTLGVVDQ
jgi:exosome complex component RRP43